MKIGVKKERIIVDDVGSFLNFVRTCKSVEIKCDNGDCLNLEQKRVYYRGQPDAATSICSSIFRGEINKIHEEYKMLRQAERVSFNVLPVNYSFLEKLVMFQHYGLHTRLLDITFNPLVALYFACYKEFDKDGIVYCGHDKGVYDKNIVECIAKLAFEDNKANNVYTEREICNSFGDDNTKPDSLCFPYFVLSPLNNNRIIIQDGAFLIAPYFKKQENDLYMKCCNFEFEIGDGDRLFYNKMSVIPKERKRDILEELSLCGINEGFLFPELEHKLSMINESINKNDIDI